MEKFDKRKLLLCCILLVWLTPTFGRVLPSSEIEAARHKRGTHRGSEIDAFLFELDKDIKRDKAYKQYSPKGYSSPNLNKDREQFQYARVPVSSTNKKSPSSSDSVWKKLGNQFKKIKLG